MRLVSFIGLLAVIQLSAICGTVSATDKNFKGPFMETSDTVRPISVSQGETFIIVLPSNPSTGYSWQLAEQYDKSIFKKVKSEYRPAASHLDGAGGQEAWSFIAIKAGKAAIQMNYFRPWEKDLPPAKTEVFTIIVQ